MMFRHHCGGVTGRVDDNDRTTRSWPDGTQQPLRCRERSGESGRMVYMEPVLRFIYWNMNDHVEHHMFPMVPYHRLPELHAKMKSHCPLPRPSVQAV